MYQTFEVLIKSVPVSVKASVPYSNIIQIEFYDKSKVFLPTGYHNVFTEINLVPLDRMKNILEDIVYVEPDATLPIPDGMCKDCIELNLQDMCDDCKEQIENV